MIQQFCLTESLGLSLFVAEVSYLHSRLFVFKKTEDKRNLLRLFSKTGRSQPFGKRNIDLSQHLVSEVVHSSSLNVHYFLQLPNIKCS
jgi:hypothetical protein